MKNIIFILFFINCSFKCLNAQTAHTLPITGFEWTNKIGGFVSYENIPVKMWLRNNAEFENKINKIDTTGRRPIIGYRVIVTKCKSNYSKKNTIDTVYVDTRSYIIDSKKVICYRKITKDEFKQLEYSNAAISN